MEVLIIQPASFLYFDAESTLRDLSTFHSVGEQLSKEAVACKMRVCGALQWHYHSSKKATDPFRVDVALPVQSFPDGYDGIFHLKRTEAFKCVAGIHSGPWTALADTYRRVMDYVSAGQLEMSHYNREVYVAYDANNPSANLTWVQVGIS